MLNQTRFPFKELKSNLDIDISKRTIQQRFHEADKQKWRAVKRHYLNSERARSDSSGQRHNIGQLMIGGKLSGQTSALCKGRMIRG